MTNVASLELSKTLWELSGWGQSNIEGHDPDPLCWYTETAAGWLASHRYLEEYRKIPAYDLGYLLRKLPPWTDIEKWGDTTDTRFQAVFDTHSKGFIRGKADTPEDAACKLAIELFKQGILTR